MDVIFTPSAKKQIKKLPKFIQLSIINKVKLLKSDRVANSIKLSGYANSYRIRIADYRVVYRILNKTIFVVLVAHRRGVYLLLKRILN